MTTKTLNAKILVRRDTTANWNAAIGFIPESGEVIVYTDYKTITENNVTKNVPGIKIGSGNGYVQDLAFIGEAEAKELLDHINDNTRHLSQQERLLWNNKLNVNDAQEVDNETLIFNRN